MKDYSKEELVAALEKIEVEYPAVFRNFFLSEIEEKKNDSLRQEDAQGA